ncbi:MAG: penicillin-binding protein 1C, partial [Yoonia sp.]
LLLSTAQLPLHLQHFGTQISNAMFQPRIAFPPDGAVLDTSLLTVKVRDGRAPYVWLSNGVPVARSHRQQVDIMSPGVGFSSITVIDADGFSDQATIEVQ